MSNSLARWENTLQHDEMVGHLALVTFIQTQRPPARRHQPRIRLRISARKERHFVALSHQFLGEIRHHAFRSPVIFRRHTFIKRRHLCNSHTQTSPPSLKFLDPAQAGQIIPADSRGSYRCAPQSSRSIFPAFYVRVRQRKRAHALPFSFEKCIWSDSTARAQLSSRWCFANNFAWFFIFA